MTDISCHLNNLNQQLQGEAKSLPIMYQCILAFQLKLTLFSAHLAVNNFMHFPWLGKMVLDVDSSLVVCKENKFATITDDLANEFEQRFVECRAVKSLFLFTINPFSCQPDSLIDLIPVKDLASVQLALIELHNDVYLNTSAGVQRTDCVAMWKSISAFNKYQTLCDVAQKVMSMFGSTYRCESAFSAMKGIKSKDRNRLTDTHLLHCLRAATTNYEPTFKNLVSAKQCQGSHKFISLYHS